jgi:hypothetical protein
LAPVAARDRCASSASALNRAMPVITSATAMLITVTIASEPMIAIGISRCRRRVSSAVVATMSTPM